jgi:hypothetical protein
MQGRSRLIHSTKEDSLCTKEGCNLTNRLLPLNCTGLERDTGKCTKKYFVFARIDIESYCAVVVLGQVSVCLDEIGTVSKLDSVNTDLA